MEARLPALGVCHVVDHPEPATATAPTTTHHVSVSQPVAAVAAQQARLPARLPLDERGEAATRRQRSSGWSAAQQLDALELVEHPRLDRVEKLLDCGAFGFVVLPILRRQDWVVARGWVDVTKRLDLRVVA
jgi:hypothetical protein